MTQEAIYYGKTESGQMLYDLAFATLTDKWLARKHRVPIAEIRRLRAIPSIRRLAKQVAKERGSY